MKGTGQEITLYNFMLLNFVREILIIIILSIFVTLLLLQYDLAKLPLYSL